MTGTTCFGQLLKRVTHKLISEKGALHLNTDPREKKRKKETRGTEPHVKKESYHHVWGGKQAWVAG